MNYLRDERYRFGLFTSYYVFLEGSNKNIFDPGLCVNLLAFSNILPRAPYPGHGFLSAVGHLGDAREILRPGLGTESSLLEFHTWRQSFSWESTREEEKALWNKRSLARVLFKCRSQISSTYWPSCIIESRVALWNVNEIWKAFLHLQGISVAMWMTQTQLREWRESSPTR